MATCAKCNNPLEVEIPPDSDSDTEMDASAQTIPDDVHLPCNCHLHWECLLDNYDISTCPSCNRNVTSTAPSGPSGSSGSSGGNEAQQIIVNLNNEGGFQSQIDIFPLLQEEQYLRAYPEERKCRAFLEFCREGDHRAIVDLLQSCSEGQSLGGEGDDDVNVDALNGQDALPTKTADEVLRYQDPIGEMQSGLHAAAANGNREVAWLLLLLASEFPELEIPALVFQEAATLGVMREDQEGKVDIRSLRDAQGRTAEDVAKEAGVVWNGWIGNGRLAIP